MLLPSGWHSTGVLLLGAATDEPLGRTEFTGRPSLITWAWVPREAGRSTEPTGCESGWSGEPRSREVSFGLAGLLLGVARIRLPFGSPLFIEGQGLRVLPSVNMILEIGFALDVPACARGVGAPNRRILQ